MLIFFKHISICTQKYFIFALKKAPTDNSASRPASQQLEKWIVLDGDLDHPLLLDQVAFLQGRSISAHAKPTQIPETVKFIFETPTLNNICPAIISKALLVVQKDLDWKSVLETKVNEIALKYTVPQKKISFIHEASGRFFAELAQALESLEYRTVLHGNVRLGEISFANFVVAYISLLDCLLNRFIEELKQFSEGSFKLILENSKEMGEGNVYDYE